MPLKDPLSELRHKIDQVSNKDDPIDIKHDNHPPLERNRLLRMKHVDCGLRLSDNPHYLKRYSKNKQTFEKECIVDRPPTWEEDSFQLPHFLKVKPQKDKLKDTPAET